MKKEIRRENKKSPKTVFSGIFVRIFILRIRWRGFHG